MLKRLEPAHHHGAHLALQGHDVRNQAQAQKVCIAVQQLLLPAGDGRGKLKGHARAGEVGVGIGTVRPVGVHHGHGPGQVLFALVVVGDHKIHPKPAAQLRLVVGGDAAVHGDDEIDLLAVELADGQLVEPVALFQAGGDIAGHPGPETLQKIGEQTRGGDAVHVIVPKHGDMLPPGDGKAHPVSSGFHVLHQEGRAQGGVGAQVVPGALHVPVAPGREGTGAEGPIAGPLELLHFLLSVLRYVPSSKLHTNTHPKSFSFDYNIFFRISQCFISQILAAKGADF